MSKKSKQKQPTYYNLEKNRKKLSFKIATFLTKIIIHKPKYKFTKEEWPNEPIVLLSNHVGKKAPSKIEIYSKRELMMWGAHEMAEGIGSMHKYLTTTYYHEKKHLPKWLAWIVGTVVCPFVYARYQGMRILPTYRDQNFFLSLKLSIKEFEEGKDIVIFPEDSTEGYNDEIEKFFSGFVSLLEMLLRKGRDAPVFVTYFNKKINTFIVSEMMRFSELKNKYNDRDAIAEALRIKMNGLRGIKA